MSSDRDPATDQQLPEVNDQPFVQDLVLADIEARKQLGIRKYGTALQAGNGRNMLLDAYEEALDLAIYLRGALEEQQTGEPPRAHPDAALVKLRDAWQWEGWSDALLPFPTEGIPAIATAQRVTEWLTAYIDNAGGHA